MKPNLCIHQYCSKCKSSQDHTLKMDLPEKYIYQCDQCKKSIIRVTKGGN